MIQGNVADLHALVNVVLRLPNQPDFAIECVVDTGFEGALALPPAVVTAMNLPFAFEVDTNLASNTSFRADVHLGTVVWEGQELYVTIVAMGRRPLLGTALLRGCDLHVEFEEGGEVRIEPR